MKYLTFRGLLWIVLILIILGVWLIVRNLYVEYGVEEASSSVVCIDGIPTNTQDSPLGGKLTPEKDCIGECLRGGIDKDLAIPSCENRSEGERVLCICKGDLWSVKIKPLL